MERFHEALAAANQAIQLSTNIAQPYLAKANAFLGLERDEDAIEAFRMASQMDAQNPEILLEWSDVLSTNLGRGPEALQLVRRAHELDPGRAKIYPRWVKLELSYGNSSAAATALNSWRQLEPQSPEIAPFEAQLKERRP
jgi:tetratricopeptide (TPR) repeat protein